MTDPEGAGERAKVGGEVMFNDVLFFMYIFAGFAGVLAILMVVLLIKHWSQGNKALLGSIRNFMICTALIDFLYFYYEYQELLSYEYGSSSFLRVADIVLFIGQVYFWNSYVREKSRLKAEAGDRMRSVTLILAGITLVLAVTLYGFLMDGYYLAAPDAAVTGDIVFEIVICILLTFINVWHLRTALSEVVQKKCRIYITLISVFMMVNGIWNGILVVVVLVLGRQYAMDYIVDPTSVFIFIINIITILLILSEDFTAIFKTKGSGEEPENELAKRLDYIAEVHFLTEREREVMVLAYRKLTNPEIADRLCISKYTVKNHMHNIFEKLDVSTRAELADLIDSRKE